MSSPIRSTEPDAGLDSSSTLSNHSTPNSEHGWLNSRCRVKADRAIHVDNLLTALVGRFQSHFSKLHSDTAQLKITGFAEGRIAVAHLTGDRSPVKHERQTSATATDIELIVNARVAMTPEQLEQEIRTAVAAVAEEFGGRAAFGETSSFQPEQTPRLVETS